jgi:hypothetical protein
MTANSALTTDMAAIECGSGTVTYRKTKRE